MQGSPTGTGRVIRASCSGLSWDLFIRVGEEREYLTLVSLLKLHSLYYLHLSAYLSSSDKPHINLILI